MCPCENCSEVKSARYAKGRATCMQQGLGPQRSSKARTSRWKIPIEPSVIEFLPVVRLCARSSTARDLTCCNRSTFWSSLREDTVQQASFIHGLKVNCGLRASQIRLPGRLMAQTQDGTSRVSTRKCRSKKKLHGEESPAEQTLITSAERKRRKGELKSLAEILRCELVCTCDSIGLLGVTLSLMVHGTLVLYVKLISLS